ncbi:MAG TPA: bifunctional (p)ppGpp synthetase/guanosine-3',5'-bis(diphosphate) 3'-pyrophosphohydrolase [Acidimicrobiia bacterium]
MAVPEPVPGSPGPQGLFEQVVGEYLDHHPDDSVEALQRAFDVAAEAHRGQSRQTGDPYITHPLIVAGMLAGYGLDRATITAAILHDVIEDTPISLADITEEFGAEVAGLIDGVTKLDRIKFSSREEQQAASIRKMAIAMSRDIRVLVIKLVDRLHNIRTIGPLSEDKQQRVAAETLEVYAPLAHRLGMQEIKHEMEDTCFAVLFPKRSAEIDDLVRRRAPERETLVEKVLHEVRGALEDVGIEAEVTGRPKHLYSIYRKMVESGLAFEEIYDLIGIRIIVPEVRDCYAALGLIHTLWPPIHGRFKDYIATPKFNLYQSLHTTVVGPDGKALEVQIRTSEMHHQAEFGIAAHWRYKEGSVPTTASIVDELQAIEEASSDPADFLSNLKLDLYQDEVFALTPKGRVISLPQGATPVDFAYRIHTDIGHRCVGAKVNGRLVPLNTRLASGDIVEVITSRSPEAHPSRDWLEFVKSGRAAAKIRHWFSKERREAAAHDGREAVTKAIRREGLGLSTPGRERMLVSVAEDLGYQDLESLYAAVGEGRLAGQTVANRIVKVLQPDEEQDLLEPPTKPMQRRPQRGIIVEGMDDLLVRIARCCAPVPGDNIIGFVTVGRGVSVHRADCANIGALEERSERLIEVAWASEQTGSFYVWLQVEALDRPRLLRDVTSVLSDLGANIHASSSGTGADRIAILRYEVELSDPQLMARAIAELRGVDGVFDAYRLVPQSGD